MTMKIRLSEGQRNCLRFGYTIGHGSVAVPRADTLAKLVSLRLIVADADGKGGRLTGQGTNVAISIDDNPDKTTFEIMSAEEFDAWEAEQARTTNRTSSLSFLGSPPPQRLTGVGSYAHGRCLPDDSDITRASVPDLVVSFCAVMDSVTRTNNTTSLAELGRYAGRLWWEMTGRGVEFK